MDYLEEFYRGCHSGNLEQVKEAFRHPIYTDRFMEKCFLEAAKNGYADIVEYLLTSPDVSHKPTYQYLVDAALVHAAGFGSFKMVDFLLTSTEIPNRANIHVENELPLIRACNYQHCSVIELLMSQGADIGFDNYLPFRNLIDNYEAFHKLVQTKIDPQDLANSDKANYQEQYFFLLDHILPKLHSDIAGNENLKNFMLDWSSKKGYPDLLHHLLDNYAATLNSGQKLMLINNAVSSDSLLLLKVFEPHDVYIKETKITPSFRSGKKQLIA